MGRVVITGMGIWSCLGTTIEEVKESLYNGKSGIGIEEVRLDAEIGTSIVDFRTIGHFAPQLEGNTLRATISGMMSGCIDDFRVKDLNISSHAGGFSV